MIRPANPADGEAICSVYNYYIENSIASFETIPLTAVEMENRICEIITGYPYLVWEDDGEINGYAYASKWRERSAYRYSAGTSVYVRNGFQGRGIGKKLMVRLLEEVRKTDIHSLIAGIALPNDRSAALHESLAFKKVAHFTEIGYKFGKWIDVGNWELLLK